MEVNFSTQDGIQFITIAGAINEPEAAAIRFKLDRKINQGRYRVLFDLTRFELKNNAARQHIKGIIAYSLNRGAATSVYGVPPIDWPLLILNDHRRIEVFANKTDAVAYVLKANPDPKGMTFHVPSAKASGGKTEQEIQEEIKTVALQALLKKYEMFQQTNELDPFSLESVAEQFEKNPTREALTIERKASERLAKTREEIKTLEKTCDSLAIKVKGAIMERKNPSSPKEIELKEKNLLEEISKGKEVQDKIEALIQKNISLVTGYKKDVSNTKISLSNKIIETNEKIIKMIQENEELQKRLAEEDAKNQAAFEATLQKYKQP